MMETGEEAVAVWDETSAKSSVIKFGYLNHKEFICKIVSKRKPTTVNFAVSKISRKRAMCKLR